ncbi:MAG: GGDEF domain-containing protein [Kangiellaceae bacterium]|nr:GGDEF domain-containing protein [Kangiellaceae bacterium]MCW8998346.1 GGDEF domain-containing protein [Kangiellaceae bacterium]
MELLLWRWSTIVQISSAIMIALFFLSLARSTQRVELRPWVGAWLANLAALVVTVLYWLLQPDSIFIFKIVAGAYIFFKSLFVTLLLAGVQQYVGRPFVQFHQQTIVLGCFVFAFFGGLLIPSIDWLGVVQASVICIGLSVGTIIALRMSSAVLAWIAVGFGARAILALVEAISYGVNATVPENTLEIVRFFLASHSSFDSAAEWCIALGCVLALYRTIQNELTTTCDNLVEVKNELQDLVDKDVLTGLGNRRTLRHVLNKAKQTGATIVFFDLDNFKMINDRYGHKIGDLCLQLFANALQLSFRREDHIIRYAGDEFVVVACGVEPDMTHERIESVHNNLDQTKAKGPTIKFSVGAAYLEVGGEPDVALHRADEAMYSNKLK